MKILIINGANLDLLGIREKNIYGERSYDDLISEIDSYASEKGIVTVFFQSNSEGDIIDKIQSAIGSFDGIIINAGAFTHTSLAIADAIKLANIPTVEVHISKLDEREDFRQISYLRQYCANTVSGKGFEGYTEAMDFLYDLISKKA